MAFKALADGNVEVEHPRHVIQQEKEVVDASPPAKRVVWPCMADYSRLCGQVKAGDMGIYCTRFITLSAAAEVFLHAVAGPFFLPFILANYWSHVAPSPGSS